ncbi:MAG: hypothetical protein V7K67_08575 [Nostoc sp.]|uniref:hypothetical protein n=1 Tax=Nostoc sp. TaxID=1180 RepID=UPI002FFA7A07
MRTNFRIAKLMIFCISAYILIPKFAAYIGIFSTANASAFGATSSDSLIAHKANSEKIKDIYIPPNYGGPDSHNGSGTR